GLAGVVGRASFPSDRLSQSLSRPVQMDMGVDDVAAWRAHHDRRHRNIAGGKHRRRRGSCRDRGQLFDKRDCASPEREEQTIANVLRDKNGCRNSRRNRPFAWKRRVTIEDFKQEQTKHLRMEKRSSPARRPQKRTASEGFSPK